MSVWIEKGSSIVPIRTRGATLMLHTRHAGSDAILLVACPEAGICASGVMSAIRTTALGMRPISRRGTSGCCQAIKTPPKSWIRSRMSSDMMPGRPHECGSTSSPHNMNRTIGNFCLGHPSLHRSVGLSVSFGIFASQPAMRYPRPKRIETWQKSTGALCPAEWATSPITGRLALKKPAVHIPFYSRGCLCKCRFAEEFGLSDWHAMQIVRSVMAQKPPTRIGRGISTSSLIPKILDAPTKSVPPCILDDLERHLLRGGLGEKYALL